MTVTFVLALSSLGGPHDFAAFSQHRCFSFLFSNSSYGMSPARKLGTRLSRQKLRNYTAPNQGKQTEK